MTDIKQRYWGFMFYNLLYIAFIGQLFIDNSRVGLANNRDTCGYIKNVAR